MRSIDALTTELSQQRLFQRDLPKDENFRDYSTAKGSLLLFSTRLIHCPKLVQLRDEQFDPEEVDRGSQLFHSWYWKVFLRPRQPARSKSFSPNAIFRRLLEWSTGATGSDSFADWLKGEEKRSWIGDRKDEGGRHERDKERSFGKKVRS